MKKVVFISYARTSNSHRNWVRLLASHLHLIGYSVLIDENLDYGNSLTGFMQKINEAAHVLLIVDDNYVDRADSKPESGVGIENRWMSNAYHDKANNWLSVLFIDNHGHRLPFWLAEKNPKGFNFNSKPENDEFPGACQINDIWRWLEDLPANTDNEVSVKELRVRAARLERIDRLRDPGNFTSPTMSGEVTFRYREHQYYTVGNSDYEFKIMFSSSGTNNIIYVYHDYLHSVGLITSHSYELDNIQSFLTQRRVVRPMKGQSVVLMNNCGILCLVTILEVQEENNSSEFTPGHVSFTYKILHD